MPCEDSDTPRELCDDRGRDWSKATVSQEAPRISGHHQSPERGKEGFRAEVQGEHGPADSLILDLQPQTYERIHFYCFKPWSLKANTTCERRTGKHGCTSRGRRPTPM